MIKVLKGLSQVCQGIERGSVTEEVVENLVAAADSIPRYLVGPYLRISKYLNQSVVNTVKRAWQVPPLQNLRAKLFWGLEIRVRH